MGNDRKQSCHVRVSPELQYLQSNEEILNELYREYRYYSYKIESIKSQISIINKKIQDDCSHDDYSLDIGYDYCNKICKKCHKYL